VIALLAIAARAGAFDAWSAVGDAEVLESVGEDRTAVQIYRQLSRQLGIDDASRAEALYRLGRVLVRLGDIEEATKAFDECVRSTPSQARCLAERTEVEILRSSVRTLPTHWTFDDTAHGLIHPWSGQTGTIRIGVPAGESDPALLWSDAPQRGETDALVVGFALADDAPEHVGFEARAIGVPAALRLRAEDVDGKEYAAAAIAIDGERRFIDVRLATLRDDTGRALDPRLLYRLRLVDERALASAGPETTLVIDTFGVW
jgi:hypothetical protein